ncbi:hypothetical protein ACG3SL_03235 [Sphingomonas sp. CJ20]
MTVPLTPPQRQAWRVIRASGLFDARYYRMQHPGDAALDDPLAHYVREGEARGLSPHPLFDPAWYTEQLGDTPMPMGALVHYLLEGDAARRQPLAGFDIAHVGRQLPDSKVPTLAGFLRARDDGRVLNPNPFFDYGDYLCAYPDACAEGMDGYAHFIRVGAEQERVPLVGFDWAWMRRHYPMARGGADAYRRLVLDWSGRGPTPESARAVFALLHAARSVAPHPLAVPPAPYLQRGPVRIVGRDGDPQVAALARLFADGQRQPVTLADAEAAPEAGRGAAIVQGVDAVRAAVPLAEAGMTVTLLLDRVDFSVMAMLGARRFQAAHGSIRLVVHSRTLAAMLVRGGLPPACVALVPHSPAAIAPDQHAAGDGLRLGLIDAAARGADWCTALSRLAKTEGLALTVGPDVEASDADAMLLLGDGDGWAGAVAAWAHGAGVVTTPDHVEVADAILANPVLGAVAVRSDRQAILSALRDVAMGDARAERRRSMAPLANRHAYGRAVLAQALRAPSIDAFVLDGRVSPIAQQSMPARTIAVARGTPPDASRLGAILEPLDVAGLQRRVRASDADYVHIVRGIVSPPADFYAEGVRALSAAGAPPVHAGLWRRADLARLLIDHARTAERAGEQWEKLLADRAC